MDIQQLIDKCKQNNRSAQETLYNSYSSVMFGICRRYVKKEDAEDLLQDGFIKIFDKISTFKNKGSFEGWMKRIFINLALERFNRNHKLILINDNYVFDKITDNDIYSQITCNELMIVIDTLSPQYRIVFNLYSIDGYTHKEISKKLNISEGTSKSNLFRARKILSDRISTNMKYNKISI